MDIEKLIERLRKTCWGESAHLVDKERLDAADALSTLRAENENLRAELQKSEHDNVNLTGELAKVAAELDDLRAQWDMYGGDVGITATFAELEQVKRERDAAVDCIYKIEDDLDRGTDNDWAREHISEWESQKEG